MSVRAIVAVVSAIVCAFMLTVIGLGYASIGSYVPLGTYQQIDPYRSQVVTVSPDGDRAGLRAGDIIDAREMPIAERLAINWGFWRSGTVFPTPVHRGDSTLIVDQPVVARDDLGWFCIFDTVQRLILFAVGIVLIARGEGRAGLWGGLTLVGIGLYQGYAISWGAVPIGLGLTALSFGSIGYLLGFAARYFFALALLTDDYPPSRKRLFGWAYGLLFALVVVGLMERRIFFFTGYSFANSYNLFQLSQLFAHLFFVALLAAVAASATGRNVVASRVLLWSYIIGITGPIVNTTYGVLYGTVPWDGVLNVSYLLFALGFSYVVFARQLVAVNFYISKAAIYTIVLAVIVGIFILLERLIELLALSRAPSLILELAVPLVLGLSVRGIERFVERVVERVLYREKLCAEEQIEALIADFPHARDVATLARCVVDDVHRLLHAPEVVLYQESALGYASIATVGMTPVTVAPDDRAFLRLRSTLKPARLELLGSEVPGTLAVPLAVVGKLIGALVLSARTSGEPYDPDEIAMLSKLAHELAITLLWKQRESSTAAPPLPGYSEMPPLEPS